MSPKALVSTCSSGMSRNYQGFSALDSARKSKMNSLATDTKQNFAISKAKPTLFQPINMKTVKVDSFVKAY